ncbi:hypothetical protein [Spongiimicrobium sp. 3-5]|uniref:hypothetical protein n=1 Tax=Spongiimicrobium sp. 3-5 TaxID=3332596 RepID=UPI00397FE87D
MKKCLLLFTILVITLLVASFMENSNKKDLVGDAIASEESTASHLLKVEEGLMKE